VIVVGEVAALDLAALPNGDTVLDVETTVVAASEAADAVQNVGCAGLAAPRSRS